MAEITGNPWTLDDLGDELQEELCYEEDVIYFDRLDRGRR